jgi:hypothetical protein
MIRRFLRWLRRQRCPLCGLRDDSVSWRRRNCSYEKEPLNWLLSCSDCWEVDCAWFDELLGEYNEGRR